MINQLTKVNYNYRPFLFRPGYFMLNFKNDN